jgi:5-methylcytosine-specific restriction endonuclease McrA
LYCSKLGLKSEYKKRNKDKLLAYAREYHRAKFGGNRPPRNPAKLRDSQCLNCGTNEDLQLAHIKPLKYGGIHKNTITLCRKCHYNYDELLRGFWINPLSNDIMQTAIEKSKTICK